MPPHSAAVLSPRISGLWWHVI